MTEARPRKQVNIYTDGACSGNPGAGRLGLHSGIWAAPQGNERLYGGHDEQPHGAVCRHQCAGGR